MALTRQDIDNAVAGNAHEADIRHSLSNYFEDLDKPVAVAISVGEGRGNYPENVDKLVDVLRENGVDAVSFLDKQAADPSKFVVNANGIQFPFMSPEDSLKATVAIETIIRDNGFSLVGHANPLSVENMLYTADKKLERQRNDAYAASDNVIDLKAGHPRKEVFETLEAKYGNYKSFIDKKINEAYAGSQAVDFAELDKQNVYADGGEFLFRGGSLGANPYATISEFNSRKVAHSSPAPSICSNFSGKGHSYSSKGGAVYETTESGMEYGFIYKLRSMGDEQKYYCNVGLETALNPKSIQEGIVTGGDAPWNGWNGGIYETPVLPHHNKLETIYIHVGAPGENRLFEIPLDENGNIADPEWRDFMELHEPTDDKTLGYLAQRQDAQKKEQTENPNHIYAFELKKDLQKDTQDYLKEISTKDFVGCFIHKSKIREDEDGHLEIDDRINLQQLKLAYLPNMANLKINGNLFITEVNEIKAANLPETTEGISCLNCKISDTHEITAEKFTKIVGAENKNGWYSLRPSSNNSLNFDGIPQGWENIRFDTLPSYVNMKYDSLEQIPETRYGIGNSGIEIKDQTSIQNMPVDKFLYKINGNVGTRNFPPAMESEEFTPVEKNSNISLHLKTTNITTFPKGFEEYGIEQIIMNSQAKVTSLNNFPVTKKGVYNLNFDGDLKNETMLSFLNKVKGTEWVQNNTSIAEDGHLIINGELDFASQRWSEQDKPQISITSLPKDFDRTEIKGRIAPHNIENFVRGHQFLKERINDESLSIPMSHQKDFDWEQLKCSSFEIKEDGNFTEKVPQNLKELHISDNKALSALPELPESCEHLALHNVSVAEVLNIPNNVTSFYAHQTTFEAPPAFPPKSTSITLNNVEITQAKTLDFGKCQELRLNNIKIPDGTTLDLRQCQEIDLSNIDLSKCQIILPKEATSILLSGVKFPDGYKLDLSGYEKGSLDGSLNCAEIKLPKKSLGEKTIIPDNVKEVSTAYLASAYKVSHLPEGIKITDNPDEHGRLVSLKTLQYRGVPAKQIATLRKDRIKNKILSPFKKLFEKTDKKKDTSDNISLSQNLSAREKITSLRGMEPDSPQKKIPATEYEAEKTAAEKILFEHQPEYQTTKEQHKTKEVSSSLKKILAARGIFKSHSSKKQISRPEASNDQLLTKLADKGRDY